MWFTPAALRGHDSDRPLHLAALFPLFRWSVGCWRKREREKAQDDLLIFSSTCSTFPAICGCRSDEECEVLLSVDWERVMRRKACECLCECWRDVTALIHHLLSSLTSVYFVWEEHSITLEQTRSSTQLDLLRLIPSVTWPQGCHDWTLTDAQNPGMSGVLTVHVVERKKKQNLGFGKWRERLRMCWWVKKREEQGMT